MTDWQSESEFRALVDDTEPYGPPAPTLDEYSRALNPPAIGEAWPRTKRWRLRDGGMVLVAAVALWLLTASLAPQFIVPRATSTTPTGDCGLEPILTTGVACSASTTGLAGVGLTTADLTTMTPGVTTSNGQVISRKLINGNLCVVTNNVTIKESKITGWLVVGRRGYCSGSGDVAVTGLVVQDNDLDSGGDTEGIDNIASVGAVFKRNNVCCSQNFGSMYGGQNSSFLSNYMHDESSNIALPHFDGIELYDWAGTLTIRNNVITQTLSDGATSPLNITPSGPMGGLLVEYNIITSVNPSYVILMDNNQGGTLTSAIFNFNRLGRVGSASYFDMAHSQDPANISGTGNVDHNSGAAIIVP